MKARFVGNKSLKLALVLACAAPAVLRAADAAPGNVSAAQIPLSAFTIPSGPKDGRNPFYPHSTYGAELPKIINSTNSPVPEIPASVFVLNGITSPPKRTAMINGRTFEVGEEGEVRLPGGSKAMIKCVDIKVDSAIILVGGQRKELRLRFGV